MMAYEISSKAKEIYSDICDLPIISPHGHCDPIWFSENASFPDPAELLVIPDHYVFRMLYALGVPLADLGIGVPESDRDSRAIFKCFAQHWHAFLGTPSHIWMSYVLEKTLGIDTPLGPETADTIYDQISERLVQDGYRPRSLFDRFNIEVLATTDPATDALTHHKSIRKSGWGGKVIPTFRPDGVLDPNDPDFLANLENLKSVTNRSLDTYLDYREALIERRNFFQSLGATATDHAIEVIHTTWLSDPETTYQKVRCGMATVDERLDFYGHMLVEMAQMSAEDGLVMQIHGGSKRNTNAVVMQQFGRDKGADIPIAVDWVNGLETLLNRVGNHPNLSIILFTLDETTYARELAPMAGHWPCLKIGPPWWFHDSPAGIARYFDQVVETAGYQNLAGFNDDTRAFLSIPARHDLWRRAVATHLVDQVDRGYFGMNDARMLGKDLSVNLAKSAYRLDQ